jgi:hypothetical protein
VRRRKVRVLVVYKSGAVVRFRCRYFSASHNLLNELSNVKWLDAKPEPYFLGVDYIEAVYVR